MFKKKKKVFYRYWQPLHCTLMQKKKKFTAAMSIGYVNDSKTLFKSINGWKTILFGREFFTWRWFIRTKLPFSTFTRSFIYKILLKNNAFPSQRITNITYLINSNLFIYFSANINCLVSNITDTQTHILI